MTDAEILQSKIDHAHMVRDIELLVNRGTPSRWSRPMGRHRYSRKLTLVYIYDYANDGLTVVGC